MDKTVVSVNPSFFSKINWTQIVSLVVAVAAVFGIAIPEEWQKTALELIALITPIITIVFRTWFTGATPTLAQVKEVAKDKGLVAVPPSDVKASAKP